MLRYEYKNYFCVALWLIVCKLNMYFFKERDLYMTLDLITIKKYIWQLLEKIVTVRLVSLLFRVYPLANEQTKFKISERWWVRLDNCI